MYVATPCSVVNVKQNQHPEIELNVVTAARVTSLTSDALSLASGALGQSRSTYIREATLEALTRDLIALTRAGVMT